ncbi:tripartite tricarboxylate transporter substrate binding protein [uncultured Paracoccus sp.]|uniref:tripartite tricarboxylate transporter substrate binding protein n=1 Tax=uncultured Paracoccus sp. TaxID=189685 RepID=UPI002621799C|nr:tripartite tricarboxylate transporter substrate binding protein [uncultured Paracoccus sp.]
MKRLIYGAALALGLAGAAAAEYPEREIQGVIQWGAGGATDTVSRAMQARAEETLGERIVMTNRTGGTGLLATRFVMSRPDDGYTLLFGSDSPLSYQVLGLADLDYSDFYPVAIPGQALVVVMVPADSPYQTLEDLVAAVREQPGALKMAGYGPGTNADVISTMLKTQGEFEPTVVPFDGEGPGITAMLGGAVDFLVSGLSSAGPIIQSGRARALTVFSDKPVDSLEGVPPVTETYPELAKYLPWGSFYGAFVSKDAPQEAKDALVAAFQVAMDDPEFEKMMVGRGHEMLRLSGDEAEAYMKRWQSVTSWLLYEGGSAKASPEEFGIPKP